MSVIVLTKARIDSLVKARKQVLGQGASCRVVLVDVEGELCCLKVAKEQRYAKMFRKEFDILVELNGAAGAPLPRGTSFGFPALLTTFCGKETFFELSRLAPTDSDKLSAFLSLVRDVQQLHARGYTHNDIKENNVVVRRDADGRLQVSLIDYGLAKKIGTGFKVVSKTPQGIPWTAPELGRGAPCTPSVDIFSLGYVLNNILK